MAICIASAVVGIATVLLVKTEGKLLWIMIGAFLIAAISYLDDRLTLNAGIRFAVHICTAMLLIYGQYGLDILDLPGLKWTLPNVFGSSISLLFILWMINLYNFMDGMDGFSGGMTFIGFGVFAFIGWQSGAILFALLSLVISVSSLGFLIFNFPPAKIFMGDVGSSTLGFLVASFSLWASRERILPLWIAVLIFSPFIVDSTVTLLRRGLRGEKVWQAHKTHYYQRLVQHGWGHKKTVLWEYTLMGFCAVSAIVAMHISIQGQWAILIAWGIIYLIIMFSIDRSVAHCSSGQTI